MATLKKVVIATLATLVVIEILLQLVSLVARPLLARESSKLRPGDGITILCIGDSHTYGAPLPDHESYPSQLQVLLDERFVEPKFQVVNLGFPGVNSAFLANRLESQIAQVRPKLLLVSGGANNIWNTIESDAWEQGTWDRIRSALLRVKLFRLAAVTWSTQTEYHFTPAREGTRWHHQMPDGRPIPHTRGRMQRRGVTQQPGERPPDEQLARSVEIDMERIVRTAREHGVPVIWYNYPWPRAFPAVLDTIDATAARLGVPVLDARKDYARATADGHELKDLADMTAGLHPSGLLFGYIAESMLVLVQQVLEEEYGIEMVPADSAAAGS